MLFAVAAGLRFYWPKSQPSPPQVIKNDMNGQTDQWRELCIAAAFEDNPEKLTELVAAINKQLTDRQEQLTDQIFEQLARQSGPPSTRKQSIQ
jgi:hypothetical protein